MMIAGIIGGTGGMGSFFADVFKKAGWEVLISGRKTELTTEDLVSQADLVMISVPIRETVRVIESVIPYLRRDQILTDLTSMKIEPVRAMLQSPAEVIGLHPMFGPSVSSLAGQTIVATPVRAKPETFTRIMNVFEHQGARITVSTPEEHDRMMAVIQGLTHFKAIVLAGAMRRLGVSPAETEPFMSPVYRIETGIAGRLLAQSPELYADILTNNPEVPKTLRTCIQAAEELLSIIETKNVPGFEHEFLLNREWFGDYCRRSLDETNHIIDRMVKE